MIFQKKIYEKLKLVPKGKVVTYKNLARAVNSKAYRAVGSCMRVNHDLKKVLCYKVVESNGEIGSYSAPGGVKKKIHLLKKEGVIVKGGKVNLVKYLFSF